MNITRNEAMKDIRLTAAKAGLTFKQTNAKCNGKQLYKLVVRETGKVLVDNYSLWTAYEDAQNGYILSKSVKKSIVRGI